MKLHIYIKKKPWSHKCFSIFQLSAESSPLCITAATSRTNSETKKKKKKTRNNSPLAHLDQLKTHKGWMCKFKIKKLQVKMKLCRAVLKARRGKIRLSRFESTWRENVNESQIYEDKKRSRKKKRGWAANKSKETPIRGNKARKRKYVPVWHKNIFESVLETQNIWFKTSGKWDKSAFKRPKIVFKFRFSTCFRLLSRSRHVNAIFKLETK